MQVHILLHSPTLVLLLSFTWSSRLQSQLLGINLTKAKYTNNNTYQQQEEECWLQNSLHPHWGNKHLLSFLLAKEGRGWLLSLQSLEQEMTKLHRQLWDSNFKWLGCNNSEYFPRGQKCNINILKHIELPF